MNKNTFMSPNNTDRPYMIQHAGQDFESVINHLENAGFGGVVMNCEWHTSANDSAKYLENKEDFEDLDRRIEIAGKHNFGVWLYDEKGYPSASADGLTLAGHPEYEAKGLAQLVVNGDYSLSDGFEKIVYACKQDGCAVPFDAHHAVGADYVYVVRTAFEGSHAEKCGWGPRRYPNLMSREAVKAFIDCTYEKYYAELRNFSAFEAVFTDEPSLMSGYVNCLEKMPYALIAWEDSLPTVYQNKFGTSVFETLPVVFAEDEEIHEEKIRYWETVGDMISEAYFAQITAWCQAHNIPFSGHCLLEECIDEHVPLYGNLLQCLKEFASPGVDILTGSPTDYDNQGFPYYMASQYVGSAARMTGKTKNVMVEVCPIQRGECDYTFEEERGTIDKIFFAGINHINSYLTWNRLGDKFRDYATHAARITGMLRDAAWDGRIGVYYPIETVQGVYRPSHIGVNSGAYSGIESQKSMETINALTLELRRDRMDSTVVDADWILQADVSDGCLCANELKINTLILPNVLYLKSDVKAKLIDWQTSGGKLIFATGAPEGFDVSENPIEKAKAADNTELGINGAEPGSIWINKWTKQGNKIWFVLNTLDKTQTVTFESNGGITVWNTDNGEITNNPAVTIDGYSSVFVTEVDCFD